jgi:glycogen debranching enzyme
MLNPLTKTARLFDPVATTGDRVYVVCSQNGLFPDPWGGHVPHEMWGVWDHPIKLLDGFWFALRDRGTGVVRWLLEAERCAVGLGYTEFTYPLDGVQVTRRDFVPDGEQALIVTLTVNAPPDRASFLDLVAAFRSDLRPAWLGERVGMEDHADRVSVNESTVVFRDGGNPWFCIVGCPDAPAQIDVDPSIIAPQQTHGRGTDAQITVPVAERTTFTFVIAGSDTSEEEACKTYQRVGAEGTDLFEHKQTVYAGIADRSRLESPDAAVNAAFQWAKVDCQMLAREVPDLGRGVGAGLPTYPWWFGIDTEYTVLPMLQSGQFDLVTSTLRLLKRTSESHNAETPGRVIHELATTGVVFNPGNLVETPAFVRAVHDTWLWTGDDAFLAEMYPFCKTAILAYTLGECDPDGDLCASGRSIIETLAMHAGFECIDVAAYTWDALLRLADMAGAAGDTEVIEDLHRMAATLMNTIHEQWWLEDEGLFADVRAPISQVRTVLEHLDQRAEEVEHPDFQRQVRQAHTLFEPRLDKVAAQSEDVDLPWLLRHWVVMCPLEVGIATPDQAARSLQRLMSPEFCNAWGMRLHPDRDAVMSINTGLLTLAMVRYGQIDDALRFVKRQAAALPLHMPGAISEALPDQWCFLQLWSAVGIISPVVEGFLGVAPRAAAQRLSVIPQIPETWTRAALTDVRVGNARVDIHVTRSSSEFTVSVTGDAPAYELEIGAYLPAGAQVIEVTCNANPIEWRWRETLRGRCVVCDAHVPADLHIRWTM